MIDARDPLRNWERIISANVSCLSKQVVIVGLQDAATGRHGDAEKKNSPCLPIPVSPRLSNHKIDTELGKKLESNSITVLEMAVSSLAGGSAPLRRTGYLHAERQRPGCNDKADSVSMVLHFAK